MPTSSDNQRIAELEAKVAELERFAGAAAHELKGPLVTLQGFLAGLESAAKAGEWERFRSDLERLQRITADLRATVDSLLQTAKAGGKPSTMEHVSLRDAARRAVDLLRGSLALHHIEVSIAPDMPAVTGTPVLWRHVFQNLIENGIEACAGAAAPRIEIGCEHSGNIAHCFVRDNGVGIETTKLDIFCDSAPGLGLPFVKRVVELHGGKVWAESAGTGLGTTIWWTLTC